MTAITVRLPDDIIQELKSIAGELNISQRRVIEEGIKFFGKERKKKMLIKQMKDYSNKIKGDKRALSEEFSFCESLSNDYFNNLIAEDGK